MVLLLNNKKEIDFLGQKPYTELPFNMENINNIPKYNSLVIVFEGFEGIKKNTNVLELIAISINLKMIQMSLILNLGHRK